MIKIRELSFVFEIFDVLLKPFMLLLNNFRFPLQETHTWHTYNVNGNYFKKRSGVLIKNMDKKARFGHDSPFGLFHMPIFGGLTKYVVLEVKNFKDHWHVCWKSDGFGQIHKLKIKNNRIKLLTGKDSYYAFGIDDNKRFLQIKIIGYGKIGDRKYEGVRLF